MNTLTPPITYDVFIGCEQNGSVGIIRANNYTHAQTKAQQLYGRHAWAQRRSLQPSNAKASG